MPTLEVGRPGSTGVRREVPVLRDGALVATLRPSQWHESATATVGDREWLFTKRRRELTGRWAVDPEDSARMRARQTSIVGSKWSVDLGGSSLEVRKASVWKGTHRYVAGDTRVAESGSTGGWSPRTTLTVDDGLPLDAQVFLLWLELVLRRRSADGAILGGDGGDGGGGGD
jgi:hypothetical protein